MASQTQTQTDPAEVAQQLAALTGADLGGTLTIMAGLCKAIREGNPDRMRPAKPGADALRIELGKWRKALLDGNGTDATSALLAAGAAALTQEG
jgi:hypothetical protein